MKRKSWNKYYVLYCVLAAMLFLCGCGSGDSAANSQKVNGIKQEGIAFVAQPISLPEYASFDDAYSDGEDVRYVAAEFHQASQQYETAFYTLKRGNAEPEMNFRLPANQRALKMTVDGAGNIYYLGYEEVPEEDGDGREVSDPMLYKLDQKGEVLLTLDLKEYTRGQEQAMIQDLAVDGENRMVLCTSDQKVHVLGPDGMPLFEVRAEGRIYDICSSGGKVFVAYGNIDGVEVGEIDVPGKKLSAKLADNIPGTQFHMAAGRNGKLLVATESSVYQYDPEAGETVKKFDWQTYDSTGIPSGILLPFGDNGVLAIGRDYAVFPMKVEATAFREAAEGEAAIPEKKAIVLGIDYILPRSVNAEIAAFNKANPDYKVEVKNYEEDYTRFNMDIIGGNSPDILVLHSSRIDQLAAKGVVEDLNPYFTGEGSLDRSDFLENVLDAVETEGHLYGMPIKFNIQTLVGKTSLLGERSGWDLEELISFTREFPEGTDIFVDTSKTGVFRLLKTAYTSQLVNTDDTGSLLDRELLVKMLEFANQYEEDARYVYNENFNLDVKAAEGQLILLDDRVCDGVAYRVYADSVFGEPVTFIGYPTGEGNGNLINCARTFAISSGSEYKDIAWEFICALLTKEAQTKIGQDLSTSFGFPIRKDALEACFVSAKEWQWNDVVLNHRFIRSRDDGATEEEVEPVRELVRSVDTASRISPDIDEIIEEEAAFYFDGTKPVEEVVDVIENRIRTYVNESK